jgi:hypothetical protein
MTEAEYELVKELTSLRVAIACLRVVNSLQDDVMRVLFDCEARLVAELSEMRR